MYPRSTRMLVRQEGAFMCCLYRRGSCLCAVYAQSTMLSSVTQDAAMRPQNILRSDKRTIQAYRTRIAGGLEPVRGRGAAGPPYRKGGEDEQFGVESQGSGQAEPLLPWHRAS